MRKAGGGLEDDDDAGGRRTGDYRSADAGGNRGFAWRG